LQFPGTSVSLSNASLNIIGNLTVSGAPLELHLGNASISLSGDLRIEAGMTLADCLGPIATGKHMVCFQGVLNVSLSPSWSPSSSPIVVSGAMLLDPKSVMVIALPTNPYSGVAPITVGSFLSIQGY